jgi:hypothetical protein
LLVLVLVLAAEQLSGRQVLIVEPVLVVVEAVAE